MIVSSIAAAARSRIAGATSRSCISQFASRVPTLHANKEPPSFVNTPSNQSSKRSHPTWAGVSKIQSQTYSATPHSSFLVHTWDIIPCFPQLVTKYHAKPAQLVEALSAPAAAAPHFHTHATCSEIPIETFGDIATPFPINRLAIYYQPCVTSKTSTSRAATSKTPNIPCAT